MNNSRWTSDGVEMPRGETLITEEHELSVASANTAVIEPLASVGAVESIGRHPLASVALGGYVEPDAPDHFFTNGETSRTPVAGLVTERCAWIAHDEVTNADREPTSTGSLERA